MKAWSRWIRRHSSKKQKHIARRKLHNEFLEPRQLLAGDLLQTAGLEIAADESDSAIVGSSNAADVPRAPLTARAPLSLDAGSALGVEFDTGENLLNQNLRKYANAAIATDEDGNYIVVRQQAPPNGGNWDIVGQRYDKHGDKIGKAFVVNHYAKNQQINPQVAIAPDGSFTVVWQSTRHEKRGWEIYARTFSVDAVPTRREYVINARTGGDQENPAVTYLDENQFVVVWNGPGDRDDSGGIYAQRIINNTRFGNQLRVNSTTKGGQQRPTVAATPDGGFIVAWDGRGTGDKAGIFIREYNEAAATVRGETRVNSDTSRDDESPHISVDEDGNFTIAWQHDAKRTDWDIHAQSFSADGTRNGGVVLVNETTGEDQSAPAIAHLNNGDYIVTWQGTGVEDELGIYARRFAANGDALGEQVLINRKAGPEQQAPAIATLNDGVAIVWETPKTAERYSIFSRRLRDADLNEAPVIEPIPDDTTGLDTPYTVPVTITDKETPDELTITATASNNATAEFDDPLPGVLTVTPELGFVGQINVVVTADDGINEPVTETFRVTVENLPPEIAPIDDQIVAINAVTEIEVEAVDLDTPDALTYVAVATNATAEFDNDTPNLLRVTPELDFVGIIEVTVTVSDGESAVSELFEIEVTTDLPPTITPIDDITPPFNEPIVITVEVTDDDTPIGDLTFGVTIDDTATAEYSDTIPNELTITPQAGFTGVIDVTVTVMDTINTASEFFQITITQPPQLDLNGPDEEGTNVQVPLQIGAGPRNAGLENLSISDDGDTLVTATVQLTNVLNPEEEILSVDTTDTFINAAYDADTGILTLTGIDSLASYETVLRSLQYENIAKDQDLTDRIIDVTVNDTGNFSNVANAQLSLESADLVAFAEALAATETVKFFGAAWCAACTAQKELFQDGQEFLPFIEVTNPDRTPNEIGIEENVTRYPTWEFPDGSREEGRLDLLTISERSGVPIPSGSQPFVAPIDDVTLLSGVELLDDDGNLVEDYDPIGSPLFVSLDGYDPNGGDLTYEVISNNPDVTAEIVTGNRGARINVAGFGDMVFELFEDKASRATDRMIELATNTTRLVDRDGDGEAETEIPFYEEIIFHRVLNDFVIQGGDPTGSGSGGSELGDFDDQFHVDLQHNRTGLLSMAKTDDDTNDSQFFITEGTARHLDFNHTIFGVLVEGEKNRDAISDTDTGGGSVPTIPVEMDGIDIFSDNENAVLLLKAAPRATGDASITVIVTDPTGNTYETSFNVTIEQDVSVPDPDPELRIAGNGGPFLTDFDDLLETDVNTPIEIDLEALDVEGDAVFFDSNANDVPGEYEFEIDNDTGVLTVTPVDDFIGVIEFLAGVRPADDEPSDTSDRFDTQNVTILVGGALPPVELGDFTDDDLLGTKTYELPGAPEVVENVHVEGDIDYSDYTNPPTYGPHHPTEPGVVPRPTGVYDTEQDDEDLVHNLEHGQVWISYNPALLAAADVTALEELVVSFGERAGVILTPRAANDSAIALASWGHLLELDTLDEDTIREFAEKNRGHAPEGFIL